MNSNYSAGGIYIHTPFCKHKCHYCDFNSYSGFDYLIDDYTLALINELEKNRDFSLEQQTVYFGGGNPALLGLKNLNKVMKAVRRNFILSETAEITIEANPESLKRDLLTGLPGIGINRLSLGFQSFNDKLLRLIGRRHTSEQATETLLAARKAGFNNINIDLIFGLPGQEIDDWQTDLAKAINLKPEHISTYCLTLEPGARLFKQAESRKLMFPDEDKQAEMMETTDKLLTSSAGHCSLSTKEPLPVTHYPLPYHHYEISNFALPGFECRHNLNYWRGGNYLGFGAGAHNHRYGHRWWNTAEPESYIEKIRQKKCPKHGEEKLNKKQRFIETIFLGLRLMEGINVNLLQTRFGNLFNEKLIDKIFYLQKQDLLLFDNNLRLSEKGRLLANEVMAYII